MEEEFIRVYQNGGHIPGVPGFFPVGIPVRIDERTNTVVPDEPEPPPALPPEEEKNLPESLPETPAGNQSEPEQGEALPVETTPILDLGMLGGNN